MIIRNLQIEYDVLNPDGSREADELRRTIQRRYPNANWERSKYGHGHDVIIPDF